VIKPVIYCFILLCFNTIGQVNLVYNGDFEIYDTCPTGFSDPWQFPKQIEHCLGWNAPTYGTSDYFNTCATGTNVAIPTNSLGEQTSFNGDGYLGSAFTNYTGGAGTDGYSGIMWWEYVQGELIQPLEANKTYKLSMEISLAEYSDLMINEVGAYFSSTPVATNNTASLSLVPQCVFHNVNFYTDTLNWMHLETTFVANGGEEYIIIGNFRNNVTTDTIRRYSLEPLSPNPNVTYLYIDDVKLEEYNAISIPNVFTPNGDGENDNWSLLFTIYSNNNIVIINRWGNIVSEGKVGQFSWNGKDNLGNDCADGVYFYRIEGTDKAGYIHLIR
jgi:gliding motility-associated-like protein